MNWLAALLITSPAHAGWLARKCERWFIENLTAPDPYQFREVSTPYLAKERERLWIRRNWGKATPDEIRILDIIEREVAFRHWHEQTTGTPWG